MLRILDVIMIVESGDEDHPQIGRLIPSIAHHRNHLRLLQGSWGRLIADLEDRGII
jgi:hypothetical protein